MGDRLSRRPPPEGGSLSPLTRGNEGERERDDIMPVKIKGQIIGEIFSEKIFPKIFKLFFEKINHEEGATSELEIVRKEK